MCRSNPGYMLYCLHGCSRRNKDGLQANTLQGYATAIETLFMPQGFKPPVDRFDSNNTGGIIITNRKREEDIVLQGYPLSSAVFAEHQRKAAMSHLLDSVQHCLF